MRNLLLIAFIGWYALADAQSLSNKKVDHWTGDTVQFTRLKMLFNPGSNYLFREDWIRGGIKKISPKEHKADTILLWLRMTIPYTLSKDSSQLHITFADGHSRNFKASSVRNDLLIDAFYPLSPADIDELAAQPLSSLVIQTSKGPANFPVHYDNALKFQRCLAGFRIAKSQMTR